MMFAFQLVLVLVGLSAVAAGGFILGRSDERQEQRELVDYPPRHEPWGFDHDDDAA